MAIMQLDSFENASAILRPGVYALVRAGVVIYVGKSKSLYQRIYAHRTTANRAQRGHKIPTWLPAKGFVFDEVWVRVCALSELDALEAEMINRYKPKFNQSLKTRNPRTILNVNGVALTMRRPEPELRRI